jgi:hypothetical protein
MAEPVNVGYVSLRNGWLRIVAICLCAICLCLKTSFAATNKTISFSADVAPILRQRCVHCHQSGGIAAMLPFTSYAAVRPWAKAIEQAVTSRQMPPWPPDAAHSLPLANDPRLSNAQIATLRAWVEGGAQNDRTDSPTLTADQPQRTNAEGRPPDLIVSMNRDVTVPAHGDMPYLRFLVKLPLTVDKWVAACETRPGNASVVHHMAITEVELPPGVSAADVDGLEMLSQRMGFASAASGVKPAVTSASNPSAIDMLAIYTPGGGLETYGPDSGKLLKAGPNRYINFNIHYAGHGQQATDRSQVAFWFRDTVPKHQIYRVPLSAETIVANGKELLTDSPGIKAEGTRVALPAIPPGAADYELIAITAFTRPVTIYQLHPHAHFRGKDFRFEVIYPDGRQQTLLTIPKFDFRWQLAYSLKTPLLVPAGGKMVITAHYDNSSANTANPAPGEEVHFLDQNKSTDEMFSPFVQYSVDSEVAGKLPENSKGLPVIETQGCLSAAAPWRLTRATAPAVVDSQASNSIALRTAAEMPLGRGVVELLGLSLFQPSKYSGERVVVRGVLAKANPASVNVTSLQTLNSACR